MKMVSQNYGYGHHPSSGYDSLTSPSELIICDFHRLDEGISRRGRVLKKPIASPCGLIFLELFKTLM